VLHRAAYDALGLDWTYTAIECTEDELAAFVGELDETWAGLSLTMPLKRAVLPLLAERSALVDTVGAANTVLVRDGRLVGDNTDVHGIAAALGERAVAAPTAATVVGAGATAAAALVALAGTGLAEVTVVARSAARAHAVTAAAAACGVQVLVVPWPGGEAAWSAEAVVSTVPAEASAGLAEHLPGTPGMLLDVVYAPWPTPLARAAEAAGSVVVGGLAVLVHQAARQVELMTGRDAPLAAMREAGERALAAPA
jgi:shikimate dehydrogenase